MSNVGTKFVIKADCTGHYLGKFEHRDDVLDCEWMVASKGASRFGAVEASRVAGKIRAHGGVACSILPEG